MATKGEWIANCLPDRVARISSASVYRLRVGPPVPNQMQCYEDLVEQGMVGLYRMGKKAQGKVQAEQQKYLDESEFKPSLGMLLDFLGPTPEGGA